MAGRNYEYFGMMAQTWDLFRGDTSKWEDRGFFLDLIHESGQPALDVGCGTGRLLLDYLSQGVDIDGLDISPEMLDLCRQKADLLGLIPTLYEGSMESIQLPRRYQTIIVPSSSFQLVLEPTTAQQAIRNLRQHLLPGGTLAMPFMKVRQPGEPLELPWELRGEKERPEDGATVKRWSRSRFDPETQLEHTEDRYQVVSREGTLLSEELHIQSPATREYNQAQALHLYEQAGFTEIRMYKEFTRQSASAEDRIFTLVGRRN